MAIARRVNTTGRLLTLRAAAVYSGLAHWQLRELVITGKLQSLKMPSSKNPKGESKTFYIDRQDLDAFIDRHKTTIKE